MSTNTKPREISQAQAKGMARDLLGGLGGGEAWRESVQAFEALSAGNRRTVIEAISQALGDAPKADPARLSELVMTAIRVGRSIKPDFAVSLIQAVIELSASFGSAGTATSANVLATLLAGEEKAKKEGLPYGAELDLARLAKSPAVAPAISELLEDRRHEALLKGALPVWSRLVAALVAVKGSECGIRPGAAVAALHLISDPQVALPVDIVLSANWLCQIAGRVPEEVARRTPFQFLLRPASTDFAERKSESTSKVVISPRTQLLSAIDGLLKAFESEIEQRRSALSSEVTRLTAELSAMERDLERARSDAFDLQRELSRAREKKEALSAEVESFVKEREALEAEVAKWRTEAQVLLDSRSNQIEQAKSECRREFVKAANTNLKNLRGFVLELKSPDKSSPGALAATALDEVIRVLHRQQFLTPEELPRLHS